MHVCNGGIVVVSNRPGVGLLHTREGHFSGL